MKPARSLPDAAAELVERQQEQAVTDKLNAVYAHRAAEVDPALNRAQLASLDEDGWVDEAPPPIL